MIANLIVGGLAAGCLYAMVGIAIVIVLNITDIANFAQGEMAMLATFFAYWLMDGVGLPWWQAVSIAVVFGLVQGIVRDQSSSWLLNGAAKHETRKISHRLQE